MAIVSASGASAMFVAAPATAPGITPIASHNIEDFSNRPWREYAIVPASPVNRKLSVATGVATPTSRPPSNTNAGTSLAHKIDLLRQPPFSDITADLLNIGPVAHAEIAGDPQTQIRGIHLRSQAAEGFHQQVQPLFRAEPRQVADHKRRL